MFRDEWDNSMLNHRVTILFALLCGTQLLTPAVAQVPTLNEKADGYRGIWYMNQPSNDEYVYKYSGGMGTYCAKHKPFAIYCREVNRTFFCYGGAAKDDNQRLLHMVSYFDHETGTVPRPTVLLDKQTSDAHDNPVISMDADGHLLIFSTSHGRARPSYIHRSRRPFDIDEFELVNATHRDGDAQVPMTNFSYMQVWNSVDGFHAFFTRYNYPAARTICFMSSPDGRDWSSWQRLAAIDEGHYQVTGLGRDRLGSMFNYHPQGKGLNWRTNLYYIETVDNGKTWTNADGHGLSLPLTDVQNAALVRDYEAEGLNVYLKDLRYDADDSPILLYITSRGYESGPKNDPRTWTIARRTETGWCYAVITTSDNNYDMGELWLPADDDWRVIAPTQKGAQPYNPGGEVVMWQSRDQGATWQKMRQLTRNSPMNHTYVRRVLDAHPDFIAFWADGHGRQPSESRLYFSNLSGDVFRLPPLMNAESARPERVPVQESP
ncbi:MAG: BNR-4 repeat-containing protein [Planctomycetaceae bacterium]|nr:BNR-4 repeat-containing protein [Planctomycetaceae bacterium]